MTTNDTMYTRNILTAKHTPEEIQEFLRQEILWCHESMSDSSDDEDLYELWANKLEYYEQIKEELSK